MVNSIEIKKRTKKRTLLVL